MNQQYCIDLNELYLFAQVVDAHGFSAASRKLNISKATISRRIAKLEQRLGVKLIQRNTYQFKITHIGELYYRHCVALATEAEAAQELIDQHSSEPQGMVRFSCPKELMDMFVGKMVVAFMQRYPKVKIHVENTNRRVDVVQERLDFAIRVRPFPLPNSDLVVKTFMDSRLVLVANPNLVAKPVETLADLAQYPSLSGQTAEHFWLFYHDESQQIQKIHHDPSLSTENLYLLTEATLNSIGIVAIPYVCVKNELARGDLIEVLPQGWRMEQGKIHAAYPSRRGMLPAVALLLDYLADQFALINIE
ncbi:hypothetical protein A4G19_14775 [Pasteurellaceae bacterium Macca]|nr:hypothetical protein [Pasteurellaceae bacterium Macca]